MIRPEDVADLRPGDVVELTRSDWAGAIVRGPLRADGGHLLVAHAPVRHSNGEPAGCMNKVDWTLTVVSRAPRLYVNSDRTEPVPGDVVRDADSDDVMALAIYLRETDDDYWALPGGLLRSAVGPPFGNTLRYGRLRLLVDGTTGQPVTS